MALTANIMFGQYLRMVRERGGLSLVDVESLSSTFPDPINKGYLSRCENGHQKIAFAKLIALSRIYEIPVGIFAEKLELDQDLEEQGGPDVEGMGFRELFSCAVKANSERRHWDGYAYAWSAIVKAWLDPEADEEPLNDRLTSFLSCWGTSVVLGKPRLALYELRAIPEDGASPRVCAIKTERIGFALNATGDYAAALDSIDAGLAIARQHDLQPLVGSFLVNRVATIERMGDCEEAITQGLLMIEELKKLSRPYDLVAGYSVLGGAYFDFGRISAARRTYSAGLKLAIEAGSERQVAVMKSSLAESEAEVGNGDEAERLWREALVSAKNLNDRILRFDIEYNLYRHALASDNQPTARAIRRRLVRLLPRVPNTVDAVRKFQNELRAS